MTLKMPLFDRYRVADNPLKTERRVELALVVVAALFVLWGLLGFLRYLADDGPAPLAPAEDSLRVKALSLAPPLTDEASAALLARPLFWAGREPYVAPDAVTAAEGTVTQRAASKLKGVVLHGVFGVNDSLGIIATVDGKVRRIARGDQVKGWSLVGYADGVATFEGGGESQSLPLELTTPSVQISHTPDPENAPVSAASKPEQAGGLSFGGSGPPRRKN